MESIYEGSMPFPINVKKAPATIALTAYLEDIFFRTNSVTNSGTNVTEPRSPMDIKLQPRIKSAILPKVSREHPIKIIVCVILDTIRNLSGFACL